METHKYNYVVTAVKPSRVDRLCVGKFTDSKDTNMITLKSNRLEVLKVTDGASGVLERMLDIDVNGDVVLLDLIRPNQSDAETRDLLIMATRHFCSVYEWDPVHSNLLRRSFRRIPEPDRAYNRHSPTKLLRNPIGVIDQAWRLIGLCVYDQQFEVIPFNTQGQLGTPYFIRITQLTETRNCSDIKFLFGCPKPTILVLREERFNTYAVTAKNKNSFEGPWYKSIKETLFLPKLILPLPTPVCGFLIFSWNCTAYSSESSYELTTHKNVTIASYAVISDWRYLVLDTDGGLHILTVDVKEERYNGLKYKNLGQTSVPGASKISILGSDLVYVCSGHGDSMLLKMRSRLDQNRKKMKFRKFKSLPGVEGSYFEAVESYVNIGPIRDFCVVDLERLGQGTVVTLSGSIRESSLRIIRYGFEMNKLASLKDGGITGLWSLRPRGYDTFLVVTYPNGTRVLAMNNEGVMKETKIEGLSCELETLFCHDAEHDQLVQVTSNSVRLVSWTAKNRKHEICFPSDNRISVATANMTQVLCAGVRSLVYLQICDGKLNVTKHAKFDYDVLCLNLNPIEENLAYSKLAAVGFWNDKSVGILSLPDLIFKSKEDLGDAVVCSVLLCALEGSSYLMCGLGDGDLVIFSLNFKTGELTDRKKVSLGSSPLTLCTFTLRNITLVFAASRSPAIIYSINKKLLFSQLGMKEVNFMCPFNSVSFTDSLVLADTDGITVGRIEYQMPHIRTILLRESIHRICSQQYSRTIALCSMKYSGPNCVGMGSVQLLSDQTFEFLSSHSLRNLETGISIVSCSFFDDNNVYYCVGTSYEEYEEEESPSEEGSPSSSSSLDVEIKGRILVFVVKDRQLELVAQKETSGSVESLICFNGKLLASVQKEIHLYKWIRNDDGTHLLELECQTGELLASVKEDIQMIKSVRNNYDGSFRIPLVATRGNLIIVGSDTEMRVIVLLYKPDSGSIEEIAYNDLNWATADKILADTICDYGNTHLRATAVEILDDGNTYLLADQIGNLVTIEKDTERATTESDSQPLSCTPVGSYHVGHCVNQFKHGSLVIQRPDSTLVQTSTVIFGTASGAIGLIASLQHDQYLFLKDLQSSLRRFVVVVGDHKEWRSDIHDEHGLYTGASMEEVRGENLLDGDLIKLFLRLHLSAKEKVSKEMNVPLEELMKRVEELTKLQWEC